MESPVNDRLRYEYAVGDLVELGRYGYEPKDDKDRIYGTVVELIAPTDYYVPVYRVRVQYRSHHRPNALDEFIIGEPGRDSKIVTVFEYDIAARVS